MRQRWFGATGRQVPEIAVEGEDEITLDEALVLDDVTDEERLREAHANGTPVVVRASDVDGVARALARPEVACVLVPAERRELRDLDLRKMTYG
jgi:Trk K+ transport system NAD-binding subunit